MTTTTSKPGSNVVGSAWLKRYYFTRAGFSIVWVGAVCGLADGPVAVLAALLLVYPAWDAVANIVDARRNGGIRSAHHHDRGGDCLEPEYECGPGCVRRVGSDVRDPATGDGGPSVEELWRAVADDRQWYPVCNGRDKVLGRVEFA